MDDVSHTSNGAPPSIAQSVVSVMTGQNTVGRKNRRTNSGMANPKKLYEEVSGDGRCSLKHVRQKERSMG